MPLGTVDQSFLGLIFTDLADEIDRAHRLAVEMIDMYGRSLTLFRSRTVDEVDSALMELISGTEDCDIAWVDWRYFDKATAQKIDSALGSLNAGRSRVLAKHRGIVLVLPLEFESHVASQAVDLWSVRTFSIHLDTMRTPMVRRQPRPELTGEDVDRLERSVVEYASVLGDMDRRTLRARADLATAYWSTGRVNDAIRIEEKLLLTSEKLLGSKDPETLDARSNIASSYWSAGRFDEAMAIQERVLADAISSLGPNHPTTILSLANLANSYRSLGRFDEAISRLEEALVAASRFLGEDHPDTALIRSNMASIYRSVGRHHEAIAIQDRVLLDSERLLGSDHPSTVVALADLTRSYQLSGRYEDALLSQQEALDRSVRAFGHSHPNTLATRVNLAEIYRSLGQVEETEKLERRVAEDSYRVLGRDHPSTLSATGALAKTLHALGRTEEALDIQTSVVSDYQRVFGITHPSAEEAKLQLSKYQTGLPEAHDESPAQDTEGPVSVRDLFELERAVRLDDASADRLRMNLEPFIGQVELLLQNGSYEDPEVEAQVRYELGQLREELFGDKPGEPLGSIVHGYFTSILETVIPLLDVSQLRRASERHGVNSADMEELIASGTKAGRGPDDVDPAVVVADNAQILAPSDLEPRDKAEWVARTIGWMSGAYRDGLTSAAGAGASASVASTALNLTWLNPLWAAVVGSVIGVSGAVAKRSNPKV